MNNEQEPEVEAFQEPNTKQEPNTGIVQEQNEEALGDHDSDSLLQEPNTR